jgi:hypothetical protein
MIYPAFMSREVQAFSSQACVRYIQVCGIRFLPVVRQPTEAGFELGRPKLSCVGVARDTGGAPGPHRQISEMAKHANMDSPETNSAALLEARSGSHREPRHAGAAIASKAAMASRKAAPPFSSGSELSSRSGVPLVFWRSFAARATESHIDRRLLGLRA